MRRGYSRDAAARNGAPKAIGSLAMILPQVHLRNGESLLLLGFTTLCIRGGGIFSAPTTRPTTSVAWRGAPATVVPLNSAPLPSLLMFLQRGGLAAGGSL